MFKKSLKNKIMYPTIGVFIVLIATLTIYSSSRFISYSESVIIEELELNTNSLKSHLNLYEYQSRASAIIEASEINIISAVRNRDTDLINNALNRALENTNVNYFMVTDTKGIVIARTDEPDNVGDSILYQDNIRDALNGKVATYFEEGSIDKVSVRTGAPIYDTDGTIIGAISAGVRFDSDNFVDELKRLYGTEATIFLGDTRVATTIIDNGQRAVGTKLNPVVAEIVLDGRQEYFGDADILGKQYKTFYLPLINGKNEAFAIIFIGKSKAEMFASSYAFMRNSVVIGIGLLVIAAVMLILIVDTINKPIKKLVTLVRDVAQGNMNINIDRTSISKDEIGVLTNDVYELIDVIRSIIDNLNRLVFEANTNGNIDYRIDTEKYNGSYKEMTEGINVLVDGFINDIMETLNALAQISNGNFNIEIKTMVGQKAILNKQIDLLTDSLKGIHAEIVSIARNASDGNFKVKADTEKYKGDWAQLLNDLNLLVYSVSEPLHEIENSLTDMSNGNFNTRMTGNYKGAFDIAKRAVNSTEEKTLSYVNEISQILGAMANGDLTVTINREYIGVYAPIKEALLTILASLNKSMREIYSTAEQVLSGAGQISQSSMYLADGATKQANAINELTDSIEKINENINLSSENADNANNLSQKSNQNAQNGNAEMSFMVMSMEGIKESSENISKVIKVIEDIAFQTNLLALNAAVEAARAGEHGKGFTVVAEEVRNLAAKSQDAAKETTDMIEDSTRKVGDGINAAHTTAASLNTIVGDIQQVSKLISEIADMSHEQADAIQIIRSGLSDISTVVNNNASASEEYAAASQELNSQAEMLKELVSFFKLKEELHGIYEHRNLA